MRHLPWILGALVLCAVAVAAAGAGSARAEDVRTRGGPTAEEIRIAAENQLTDLPTCADGCLLQDSCGWPTDACGRPLNRVEIALQGTASWLEGPKGTLGEETGAVNQVRWDDLDYDVAFGGRASLDVRLGASDRVRLRGWYLGGWDGERSETGVYGFSPPPAISPLSDVTLTSEADLWSVSLDWVRELVCCNIYRVDGFIGPRVTTFDEVAVANIRGLGVVPGPTGVVRAESDDVFYGGEIGAAFTAHATPQWTLGFQAALLLGVLQKEVRVDDSGLFTPGAKTAIADQDVFGWGVELDASVTWRPTPHLGLTLGYQFFVLADVTRANQAMDFAQFGTGQVQARNPEEDLLVHTVFAGVTINF